MSEDPARPAAPAASVPVFGPDGEYLPGVDGANLEAYNFRNPGFLSPSDLRQLGVLHQRYVQHLSARLSTFLRMECGLTVGKFNSSTFSSFCEGLTSPAHIALFQMQPLRGIGMVHFTLPLGLAIADRLLGGKGQAPSETRPLTEIEIALVDDVVQLVLTEWTHLWSADEGALRPSCIGHETSARFLQTSPPDAVFVLMEMEVSLGELRTAFTMGIPYSMIETEVKKMQVARFAGRDDTPSKNLQYRSAHAEIAIPVVAEWHVRQISLQEALAMRPGDVIQLPAELIDQTKVRLNTTVKFMGRVGVQNGCVAVQINEQIAPQ